MQTSNLLSLLAIIIALSAYLAVVRQRFLDKISHETSRSRIRDLKKRLLAVALSDALLVSSGFFLGLFGAIKVFLGNEVCWLRDISLVLFSIAIILLAVQHSYELIKSIKEAR